MARTGAGDRAILPLISRSCSGRPEFAADLAQVHGGEGLRAIQAETSDGVPENVVRTVTENCKRLKFRDSAFEES